jgi:hypothetical protein
MSADEEGLSADSLARFAKSSASSLDRIKQGLAG